MEEVRIRVYDWAILLGTRSMLQEGIAIIAAIVVVVVVVVIVLRILMVMVMVMVMVIWHALHLHRVDRAQSTD